MSRFPVRRGVAKHKPFRARTQRGSVGMIRVVSLQRKKYLPEVYDFPTLR